MSGEGGRLLAGLAGPVFFTLAGLGLTTALPALRARHPAVRAAYAYLLGLAWVAGSAYTLSHVLALPLERPLFVALGLVGAAPALAGWNRGVPRKPMRPGARSPWDAAALAVGALIYAGVLAEALTNPVWDFDGQLTWGAQARYVRAERTVDARTLADPAIYVTNPRHPLLMPLAQVAAYELFGLDDDRVIRPLYAALFPAFLLVLHDAAASLAGRRAAAIAVLVACVTRILPFGLGGGAAGTFSDFPLACFLGGGLAVLLTRRPRAGCGVAGGLLLSAAVLTKSEGSLLTVGVLAAASLAMGRARFRRDGWQSIGLASLLVLLAAVLLASWRSGIPARYDQRIPILARELLAAPDPIGLGAQRLAAALPELGLTLIRRKPWAFLWPFVAVLLGLGWRRVRGHLVLALSLPLLAAAAVAAAYVCVTPDSASQVPFFWPRLLVHTALPTFLLVALGARAMKKALRAPSACVDPGSMESGDGLSSGRIPTTEARWNSSRGSMPPSCRPRRRTRRCTSEDS